MGAGVVAEAKRWVADLVGVVYPRTCMVCGESLVGDESLLCAKCNYSMPRCNIHNQPDNVMHERLACSGVPVERAASYFYYHKDSGYANLIKKSKYNGLPSVDRQLARDFAREVSSDGFFDDVDLLLPVPLHRWKLIKRGYNQSEAIALGIRDVTGIPIGNHLRARRHSSQTHLNAFNRWLNAVDTFEVADAGALAGRHVMIIDDVVTTGATLLACAKAVVTSSPTARVSVFALSCADQQ